MIFDIDADAIMETIMSNIESQTEEMSEKILNQIDEAMPGIIQLLLQNAKEYWKTKAINSGTGWGQEYANAIKTDFSGDEGSIYVDETMTGKNNKPSIMFAKMVENGVKSWSIKDALLKSEKAKTGPSGIKYIIIPMPVKTPSKKGQGQSGSQFGGREMTSEIYNLVKSGGRAPAGTLSTSGQNISGLTQYNTRQLHSQFGIFRCVSSKSNGWIYPDVGATPVFPSVVDYVNTEIVKIIDVFCKAVVAENS